MFTIPRGTIGMILLVMACWGMLAQGARAADPPVHDHAAMLSATPAMGDESTGFFNDILRAYTPRRICMNYENPVIWLSVISDTIIALSYFTIPLALVHFARKRKDLAFNWMFVAFAVFILACGATHVFNVIAIWHAVYRLDGIVKAITAVASITTAIALWMLIPKALALPSPAALRAANVELDRARTAAEHANETKSRFLANMSHEIRTPMSAILGYADLILDPRQTPSDRLGYVQTIRRNSAHLLTIINDALDIAKIEAGKMQVHRVSCCPCRLLQDVASLMRVRAAENNVRLEVTNEGMIPAAIHTDPSRLHQILVNLVGNAIKFTPKGSVRVVMKLGDNAITPLLQFDVVDTGIGIKPEQIAKLFQPFEQGDTSLTRRYGGTGLGLTICKRLSEMLGGGIAVESEEGRGNRFSLTIDPGSLDGVRHVANCTEALAVAEPQKNEPIRAQFNGHVLLVDDSEDNRGLLSIYLKASGLRVESAENGRVGSDMALAAKAAGKAFDVILMDMQMPEMDGYTATARLRTKAYEGPIIALTAHAMTEDRDRCLSAGCTGFLSKPVRREDLIAEVAQYVREIETRPAQVELAAEVNLPTDGAQKDKTIDEVHASYLVELRNKMAELNHCLAEPDLHRLQDIAHGLKGSGGTFGYWPITTAATSLSNSIRKNAAMEVIQAQTAELIQVIQNVKGVTGEGNPKSTG